MADEEIQRAIEFIVQQQAKYDARLEKDAPRLARLEESFKMLVELARRAHERPKSMSETRATVSQTMNELEQRTISDESSRLASLDESFKLLVELKNKRESTPNPIFPKKPPRQVISEAEFRRRLKERTLEWRKERLAELRSKNSL